jgi:hypothetical protein
VETAASARRVRGRGSSPLQTLKLTLCQCPPMPARQIAKPKIADSNTDKMLHVISDRLEHAANLTIDSLPQHDAQTRRRDGLQPHNLCSLITEMNPAQQSWRECRIPRLTQGHLVFLFDLETWMREALRNFAIIGDKKQTLSLGVKTTDIEEPRKFWRKQIKDSVADVRIFPGRHEPGGLMQHNGEQRSNTDKFAVHLDVIARPRLHTKISTDFTVNGDATGRD